jgi:TIR domain
VAGERDFFISYTGADVAWAEWIAQTLEDAGYQTVVQAWDFRPGQDFLHRMQQAARTIAVLSPAHLGSAFGRPSGGSRSPATRPASRVCCCRYGWPR